MKTMYAIMFIILSIYAASIHMLVVRLNNSLCNHNRIVCDNQYCMTTNLQIVYNVVCSNQQVIFNALYELKQLELENSKKFDAVLNSSANSVKYQ